LNLLIGFGNKARHGKDTAAQAVIEAAFVDCLEGGRLFKFADSLYEICRIEYGMVEKDASLMQRVGSEMRAKDPDVFVNATFAAIDSFFSAAALVQQPVVAVISDVRYKNEALRIRERGGYLVNVQRLHPGGNPFIAPDRPATHQSELDLDNFDWDFYIKAHTGEVELVERMAVTIFQYVKGLQ
jgi:hypothetical protein